MQEFIHITKALSDPNRARALVMLTKGRLCVCQLIELLDLAPSTVSKHMSILHQAGLVKTTKEGRWIFYELSDSQSFFIQHFIQLTADSLTKDKQIKADFTKLAKIVKINKEKLCQHYRKEG